MQPAARKRIARWQWKFIVRAEYRPSERLVFSAQSRLPDQVQADLYDKQARVEGIEMWTYPPRSARRWRQKRGGLMPPALSLAIGRRNPSVRMLEHGYAVALNGERFPAAPVLLP